MGCAFPKIGTRTVVNDIGGGSRPPQDDNVEVPKEKQGSLLDNYTLGNVLGQGAFGIVYQVQDKVTKETFAVKMIDQVETPKAEIQCEIDMLKRLAHSCVVKLHRVYNEKVFVCLVMDLHKGGDMIEGMQTHWKSKGMIPMSVCQNICKMMFQGVDWLHQNNVVHRDLKGDNFLQSRPDIEHKACRIFLTDFGTVADLPEGMRLKSRCGTKTYWSPEFYSLNYGPKVDIWAMGVVLYGMVTGRFPFKGEDDVRNKAYKVPTRSGKDGEDFICKTLDRNEEKRLSASQALQHKFLASVKSAAEVAEAKEECGPDFKAEVKEPGANAGIKQRREELVYRLENANNQKSCISDIKMFTQPFEALKPSGVKTKFEWWSPAKCDEAKFFDESKLVDLDPNEVQKAAQLSQVGIETMLKKTGVDLSKFNISKAKSFPELLTEVQSGQSRLMLDAAKHKAIVRAVDVLLLRIVYSKGAGGKKYLVTLQESMPDGRLRANMNQLAGTKKLPHENGLLTARRILTDRIGVPANAINFDFLGRETLEEDELSPSYPGVRTVYRKEIFEGQLVTTDEKVLAHLGLGSKGDLTCNFKDEKGYSRQFRWLSDQECKAKGVQLRSKRGKHEFSALVSPPIGFDEEGLHEFLEANNVNPDKFGKDGVKTLQEFSEELVKGEATLTRQPDGTLIRLVDVTIVKAMKPNGEILVEMQETQKDGTVKQTKRLPATKRRYDENMFWAAHRVLTHVMNVNENLVFFDHSNVTCEKVTKDSKQYAGLPTRYTRYFIPATVYDPENSS